MSSEFWIQLASVTETPGPFRIETTVQWWERANLLSAEPRLRLLEPFVLNLEGYRLGRRLLFRGELGGRLELECASCTELFAYAHRHPVELLLEPLPAGAEVPEYGLELDPEEDALARYAGESVSMEPVLVEALLLSWPMHARCAETCRGLCPSCGRNLNREACGCGSQAKPGPFDRLASLLPDRSGSGGTEN